VDARSAAERHRDYIAGETLALSLDLSQDLDTVPDGGGVEARDIEMDGVGARIALERAVGS
jgi:hypothetical protein